MSSEIKSEITLRDLTQNVRDLKKSLQANREKQESCCGSDLYNALRNDEYQIINQIYDAVGDLREMLKAVTGIDAFEFPDLLRDHGYVGGANVVLPKRISSQR